jgi:predicted RNase H-like nuclease
VPTPLPYTPIAGVVPCPGGWLVQGARLIGVNLMPEEPVVLTTLVDVVDYRPAYATIALGAPIGFADEPIGGYRTCDVQARAMLGWPRRTTVPRVPSREALHASSFEKAAAAEPWLTRLAYRHFPRWREIDAEIQPYHQRRVFSALPELSFYLVNGDAPTSQSSFWPAGPEERLRLLRDRLPGLRAIAAREAPKGASLRHVMDAAGLLWTARRITGKAITRLPVDAEWDGQGRRMELVR